MNKSISTSAIFFAVFFLSGVFAMDSQATTEKATLGGGCFWCLEAVFQDLQGVSSVESGYSGGRGTPDYKAVCTGTTGHAEVIQVVFDPEVTPYEEVLAVFFTIHDPTTLNRQGADTGTQYRSVIFYHSPTQKKVAQSIMKQLEDEKVYNNPVVTELSPLDRFYRAEDYHQDYYSRNSTQGYCRAVIDPKIQKFRQKFASKSKSQ
jgi:peptide-methionine (S)-S-oxide reductase